MIFLGNLLDIFHSLERLTRFLPLSTASLFSFLKKWGMLRPFQLRTLLVGQEEIERPRGPSSIVCLVFFVSISPRRQRPQRRKHRSKSPLRRDVVFTSSTFLADQDKASAMYSLFMSLDDHYFWTSPRNVKIAAILGRLRRTPITRRDIAQVMQVSEGVVSSYWH